LVSVNLRCSVWFVALDLQLIADLGVGPENRVRWKLDDAFRAKVRPSDRKGTKQFMQANNFEVLINKNGINWEEHAHGMDGIGGHDPHPGTRFQGPLSEEPDKAA
jgi:hypothetical protein